MIYAVPQITKIAVVLIFAFIFNLLFSIFSTPYLTSVLFGTEAYSTYKMSVHVATMVTLIIHYVINIIIAFWIYREAKKCHESAVTWALFALFFGLIAVITFYLILLIKEIKILNKNLLEQGKNKNEL